MTTAAQKLAEFGITIDLAHDWVLANMTNPAAVLSVAAQYGVTNTMLGEIAAYPGAAFSPDLVKLFFSQHGLDSSSLDPAPVGGTGSALLPAYLDAFTPVLDLNDREGTLATATIRAQVLANPALTNGYWNLFDPDRYPAASDGVFTPEELGVGHLGTIAATKENLESLFIGTYADIVQSLDQGEVAAISTFFVSNLTGIFTRNQQVMDQYIALFVEAESDAASPRVLPDSYYANILTVGLQGLAGSGGTAVVWDSLLTI